MVIDCHLPQPVRSELLRVPRCPSPSRSISLPFLSICCPSHFSCLIPPELIGGEKANPPQPHIHTQSNVLLIIDEVHAVLYS